MFTPTTSVEPQINNQDKTKELLNFLQQDINNTMVMEQYKQKKGNLQADKEATEPYRNMLVKDLQKADKETQDRYTKLLSNPYANPKDLYGTYSAEVQKNTVDGFFDKAKEGNLKIDDLLTAKTKGYIDANDYNRLLPTASDYVDPNIAISKFQEYVTKNNISDPAKFIEIANKFGVDPKANSWILNEMQQKRAIEKADAKSSEKESPLSAEQAKITKHTMRKDGLTIDGYRTYIKGDDAKPYAIIGGYGLRNGVYVKFVNGKWIRKGDPDPTGNGLMIEVPKSVRGALMKAITKFENANIDARGRDTDFSQENTTTNTTLKRVKYVPE